MSEKNDFSLLFAKCNLSDDLLSLSQNEKKLRLLIDMIQEFIVVKDGRGGWLVTNKQVLEAYELKDIEYRGKTDLELSELNPKYREPFEYNTKTDEEAWSNRSAIKIEKTINGQVWEVIKTPFFDEDGNRHHLVIVSRNITERKNAEAKLQESEMKYRLITENMTDIIMTIDCDGIIQYLSPSFELILGYPSETHIGVALFQLLHPEDTKRLELIIKDMNSNSIQKKNLECRMQKSNKEYIWYESLCSCIYKEDGSVDHIIIAARDITDRKMNEAYLEKLAYQDDLTGVYNRRFLKEKLPKLLNYAEYNGTSVGLIYLDIDSFKQINDSMGHEVGDQLLSQFVKRTQSNLRLTDLIIRIGGDEFITILPNLRSYQDIIPIANKLCCSLKTTWELSSCSLEATSSLGVSVFPHDGKTMQALLSNADKALYMAKEKGRGRVEFFNSK